MNLSNAIIVPKLTMVQVDMHRYVIDEDGLREKYKEEGKDVNGIFASQDNQLKAIENLRNYFEPSQIIHREAFNKEVSKNADIIIAAGGDDHLKYISHYVDNVPILGINTDSGRSRGELLEDNIEDALTKLDKGEFEIEEQTRIEALVNGNSYLPAMSNYPLRRYPNTFGNFRYKIEFKGEFDQHKITTGIQAYTGNANEDWPRGAGKYLKKFLKFSSTEKKIAWVVHEPNGNFKLLSGLIKEGEELLVTCYKDGSAIAPDAIEEHMKLIQSGDKITFRIAQKPLKVVKVNYMQ